MFLHFLVPPAIVEITTEDDIAFGESVTLECTAAVVRGVTSGLQFQWFVTSYNGLFRKLVRNVANVAGNSSNKTIIYKDVLVLPSLDKSVRGSIYTCIVGISNSSISFLNRSSSSLQLNFTGKIRDIYLITSHQSYRL